MRTTLFLAAFLCSCACPKVPAATCNLSPTCVQDALGQPPMAEGTPCGAGKCDGKGLCCGG